MAIQMHFMNFACRNQNFIKPKLVTLKLRPFEFEAASAHSLLETYGKIFLYGRLPLRINWPTIDSNKLDLSL